MASLIHNAANSEPFYLAHVFPIKQPTYLDYLLSIGTSPNPGPQPSIEVHWTRDINGPMAPNDANVRIAHGYQAITPLASVRSPNSEPEGALYPICAWAPDDVVAIRMTYEGGGIPANVINSILRYWTA